jgi:FkbM family methyltransferase
MTARTRLRLARLKRLCKALVGRDLFVREQISISRTRYGSEYGGWWFHGDLLGPGSLVYCFGVGDDISFDLSLIERFGLRVHAFDPTPRSIAWVNRQQLPDGFLFHPIGLAEFDGEAEFLLPNDAAHVSYSMHRTDGARREQLPEVARAEVRRLTSIMRMLGHDRIDLLKIDIEGAEYAVIRDMLDSHIAVRQILVEFHHSYRGHTVRETRDTIRRLNSMGYRIFAVSAIGRECSFIRET